MYTNGHPLVLQWLTRNARNNGACSYVLASSRPLDPTAAAVAPCSFLTRVGSLATAERIPAFLVSPRCPWIHDTWQPKKGCEKKQNSVCAFSWKNEKARNQQVVLDMIQKYSICCIISRRVNFASLLDFCALPCSPAPLLAALAAAGLSNLTEAKSAWRMTHQKAIANVQLKYYGSNLLVVPVPLSVCHRDVCSESTLNMINGDWLKK